ncbi:MAG: CRISPR-associated protein Cmr3 [Candidatus Schekmanbacteria bacterium]|nr:CRISPR-associated protein Cmr3 [Candidatus Schekmanbacteria bacterium]
MTLWFIEPRDPLVVRDGRPNRGRSESRTIPFPYPSTVAGLARTRLGADEDGAFALGGHLDELRLAGIRGPLLADPEANEALAPAPRDCQLLARNGRIEARSVRPIELPDGAATDDIGGLQLVGLPAGEAPPGKGPRELPAWWRWAHFAQWLAAPGSLDAAAVVREGIRPLPSENRVHVAIGPSGTAAEGMLFETVGLRFAAPPTSQRRRGEVNWGAARPLALLVDVPETEIAGRRRAVREGMAPAGGERRLVQWHRATELELPRMPEPVRDWLKKQRGEAARVRLVLLTPALFYAGWRPGAAGEQLLAPRHGVTPRLVAACVPRPETVSGWDFETRRPKATRRAASAGSVYWLDLHGRPDDRVRWAQQMWMSNISDGEQDRRDGFGLAAIGVGA